MELSHLLFLDDTLIFFVMLANIRGAGRESGNFLMKAYDALMH